MIAKQLQCLTHPVSLPCATQWASFWRPRRAPQHPCRLERSIRFPETLHATRQAWRQRALLLVGGCSNGMMRRRRGASMAARPMIGNQPGLAAAHAARSKQLALQACPRSSPTPTSSAPAPRCCSAPRIASFGASNVPCRFVTLGLQCSLYFTRFVRKRTSRQPTLSHAAVCARPLGRSPGL